MAGNASLPRSSVMLVSRPLIALAEHGDAVDTQLWRTNALPARPGPRGQRAAAAARRGWTSATPASISAKAAQTHPE